MPEFVFHEYVIKICVDSMGDQHPSADINGAMVRSQIYDNDLVRKIINRDRICARRCHSPVISALALRGTTRSSIVLGTRMTNIQPTKDTSNDVDLSVRDLTIVVSDAAPHAFKEVRFVETRRRRRRNKAASIFAKLT